MGTQATDALHAAHVRPASCPVCGSDATGRAGELDDRSPSCGHLLWFTSERLGDVTLVHLTDNRVAVMELLDLLDIAVLDGAVGKLLLDFGGIQTVSSAALGKMVRLAGRARSVSGRLALCHLHPDLRQVLRITRLDQIFDIHDSLPAALAALSLDEA